MHPLDVVISQPDLGPFPAISGWIGFIYYVLLAVAMWKVFAKAGRPGILALIPIVNLFVLVRIAGWSAWLGLLWFIPIANVVLGILVAFRVGGAFGKGGLFSFFLLWFVAPIGYFILGFGSSRYTEPV